MASVPTCSLMGSANVQRAWVKLKLTGSVKCVQIVA